MALKIRKSAARAPAGKTADKPVVAQAKAPARALSPFEEMDLLFDRLSRGLMSRIGFPALGESGWPSQMNAPKVDLVDKGKELVLRAEIPGISKDELKITLTDDTVTIRGETHKETKDEKGDYHRREITRGSFQRTLALPSSVDGEKARASFKDGVLELVLPKIDKPGARSVKVA